MGDPFDVRDPTALLLQVHLPAGGDRSTRSLRAVDEELDRLATDGLAEPASWPGCRPGWRRSCCREVDAVLGRALRMAVLEQQRGRAELLDELPGRLGDGDRRAGRRRRPPALRPRAPGHSSADLRCGR